MVLNLPQPLFSKEGGLTQR